MAPTDRAALAQARVAVAHSVNSYLDLGTHYMRIVKSADAGAIIPPAHALRSYALNLAVARLGVPTLSNAAVGLRSSYAPRTPAQALDAAMNAQVATHWGRPLMSWSLDTTEPEGPLNAHNRARPPEGPLTQPSKVWDGVVLPPGGHTRNYELTDFEFVDGVGFTDPRRYQKS